MAAIAALQTNYATAYSTAANLATRSPSATAARDVSQDALSQALTDLHNVNNATRSHEPIVFQTIQRGQTCFGFGRCVNKNGKVGP
ncbi:MAG: hypothetical protein PW786_10785 [Arachidicoccus sp.]|nr:hypothetical protein [Arachidicoccus sp.]